MQFQSLSQEYLNQFHQNGFLVENAAWSPAELAALKNESQTFTNFTNASYTSVMNPHKISPLFMDALAHPRILARLRDFFGGPVSAVQSQMFFGPPGCSGYSRHQDNFFLQADPQFFMSVWTSLDSADPENGGLIMYPGSQRESILEVREVETERRGKGQDPNSDRVESVFPEGTSYPAVDVTTAAGDAVYIHANVVHASHSNKTTNRFRNSLLCTYIRTGTPFRKGNYAKREELPL